MWFTEDPWPPILMLALCAIVFGIAWNATRRGLYLLVTLGIVGLAGLVFVVEQLILTEGEQVEAQVHELAAAVVEGDSRLVISFIATDAKGLRELIASRIEDVDIDEAMPMTATAVA